MTSEEINKMAQYTKIEAVPIYGGQDIQRQLRRLRQNPQIIVATPGRLMDHMDRGTVSFGDVKFVVLDEADEMLNMGFIDDIRKIMQMLPKQRQTLLFSATFSPPIRKLAQDFMNQPELIEVAAQNTANANVEQHVIAVDAIRKRNLLERLIIDLDMSQVIVFCKTKQSVDQVNRELNRRNIAAQALHGDKSQQTRLETLSAFKDGNLRVLVATDVAARGLDIVELPFVINYELPTQPEDYIHRIGRTGRAGADGVAISLMDESEQKMFEAIKALTNNEIVVERIEGFEPRWWTEAGVDAQIPLTPKPAPTSVATPTPTPTPEVKRTEGSGHQRVQRSTPEQDIRSSSGANVRRRAATDSRAEHSIERKTETIGDVCGKIPGRNRRNSRERPKCALLQPKYGA